jgi:hypothetical protein
MSNYITRQELERFWIDKLENVIKKMIESAVNERVDTEVKKTQKRYVTGATKRPTITNFGQENYEYLLMPYLTTLMKTVLKSENDFPTLIQRIIKDLYFNPDQKRNHNVYIPRESYHYACIHKDNAWRTYPLAYCIEAMIRRANDVLQHYIIGDENEEKLFEKEVGKKKVEYLKDFTNKIDNLELYSALQQKLHKDTEHTITTNQHLVHPSIYETPSD